MIAVAVAAPFLELQDIGKSYPGVVALSGLVLDRFKHVLITILAVASLAFLAGEVGFVLKWIRSASPGREEATTSATWAGSL